MCALPCMTRFGWCGWWGVGAGTERNHVCSAVYGAFVNSDADGL